VPRRSARPAGCFRRKAPFQGPAAEIGPRRLRLARLLGAGRPDTLPLFLSAYLLAAANRRPTCLGDSWREGKVGCACMKWRSCTALADCSPLGRVRARSGLLNTIRFLCPPRNRRPVSSSWPFHPSPPTYPHNAQVLSEGPGGGSRGALGAVGMAVKEPPGSLIAFCGGVASRRSAGQGRGSPASAVRRARPASCKA